MPALVFQTILEGQMEREREMEFFLEREACVCVRGGREDIDVYKRQVCAC